MKNFSFKWICFLEKYNIYRLLKDILVIFRVTINVLQKWSLSNKKQLVMHTILQMPLIIFFRIFFMYEFALTLLICLKCFIHFTLSCKNDVISPEIILSYTKLMLNIYNLKEFGKFIIFSVINTCAILLMVNLYTIYLL